MPSDRPPRPPRWNERAGLSILSALILARREEREKHTALLNTQRLPPKVYHPGDMCVVWRPPKDAELGSKLSWQNTGPYRVLASQKHGREYRLQHLTTGDICIHSATDLHPYLVTQGFDDLVSQRRRLQGRELHADDILDQA